MLLTTLACLGLGLAWAYEAPYGLCRRPPSLVSRQFNDRCELNALLTASSTSQWLP